MCVCVQFSRKQIHFWCGFSIETHTEYPSSIMSSKKCCRGPGYATPMDAFRNGPRETLLYVVTVQPDLTEPHGDYLSTVDVDPTSPTYSQIIHRAFTNTVGNELHHSGWNTCSSCHRIDEDAITIPTRDKLILPALNTSNIYVFDVATDPRAPQLWKTIAGSVLHQHNVASPHSTHCLANGNIMISTMGDRADGPRGDFILFDAAFNCLGTWTRGNAIARFGYDFWYQPKFDIMVASEWAAPSGFKAGFKAAKVNECGRSLNVYSWTEQRLLHTIDLGADGVAPLELRFLHDPDTCEGYVGCAIYSNLFHFKARPGGSAGELIVTKVVDVPAKEVNGWLMPELNGLMGDIVLSLDDKYLYMNNWLHGDIRQYDIGVREAPRLVGQIFLGGVSVSDSGVTVTKDREMEKQQDPVVLKGKRLQGGPQMMQLSLDGRRLYVSSCLYSPWDKEVYPKAIDAGGYLVMLDVDIEVGGLSLNADFLVDFGNEPYGPTLAHEIRYPGGDCTSDIWLSTETK